MGCHWPGFPILSLLSVFSELSLWVCSNLCPLSWWCHPISSSSVTLSSCSQSFPASESFLMSRFFTSGGQYWSFRFSISPSKEHSRLISLRSDWLSLLSKGLSRIFFSTTFWKHQFFSTQPPLWFNSHIYTWLLEKPYLWLYGSLLTKWCLCSLNMLSRSVMAFLPRSKRLWNFKAVVTACSDFGAQENKVCHCFHFFPTYFHEVMRPDAMILIYWMLSFKPAFSLSSQV